MKFFTLFIGLFLSVALVAQEELVPLSVNSNISKSAQNKVGDIHDLFIYEFDTLDLPFLDDFSINHFPKLDAQPSDPNVTSQTYWRIEITGTPEPIGTLYMEDTTYHYQYDTVSGFGFDSIVLIGQTALPDIVVEKFDIDDYPVTSSFVSVWPHFNIHDSVWNGTAIDDTVFYDITTADLYQDSATVYFVGAVAADSNIFWEDLNVYHNYTYATNIQTLGVVSFDGLDETGYPYDFSSTSTVGQADVLTSKPIDMSGLSASDSVYLSFLVEPGGFGEEPDFNDSLVLEFWSPLTLEWNTIMNISGYTSDNFDMQLINITSGIYFQDGFQFRFTSHGSLAGSLDVWHLDYVYLDALRSYEDTLVRDWAYNEPSPSFIEDFTSMPWPHFEFSPTTHLKSDIATMTYNSDIVDLNINTNQMYMNLYFGNTLIDSIPYSNNLGNITAQAYEQIDYSIVPPLWFDTALADTCADFHTVQVISTNGNQATEILENDTLRHTQHFSNYYSYDDGTAEGAYGLVQNGAKLAYQFNLAPGLTDSIRAISMHFSPNSHDVSSSSFFLQIWSDDGGEPGELIYSTDSVIPTLYYPEYNIGNNGFFEYVLPEKVAVSGTYYVGWKQSSADRLNIGFDMNTNNQDRIFYKTSTNWANTGFEGSLMMRPVFISDKDILLSVVEAEVWEPLLTVYPNPTNNAFRLAGDLNEIERFELIDLQGRILMTEFNVHGEFSTSHLPNGIYLLKAYSADNQLTQKKIIVSH